MKYLTKEQLSGFEHYKYSSIDTSPLSIYVMHPFWNTVVKLCPRWVAPNLLTFVGFLFTVLNFILFSYYDYNFYASSSDHPEVSPLPRWLWATAALNLFLAYTLDGIDGKQARRTQTSGPLGELFDHGLDSYTTVFIVTCMYSAFGRTDHSVSPIRMYFCFWNIFLNFFISHWEKYNTGVLFLPWGYDASMLATMATFTVTAFYSHTIWNFDLGSLSCGQLFEIVFYVSAILFNVPVALWNVYLSYRDKTGKMRGPLEALRPCFSVVSFLGLCSFWMVNSPNNVIEVDPRAVYFMTGTIFSNICCRLIVSQMSNTRCEAMHWIIAPLWLMVLLLVYVPAISAFELPLLYAVTMLATVTQIHYGTSVVQEMCHHFKIECFRIKDKSA
ncbi:ethanolaminephosphotransferase 1-like [Cloeon dipterum]|uniref:ethanolaminephosphotransferase 1-like n=1 Tax=Cloeon dipterum TaxID=197152 RepID=UPI0032208728